MTEELTIGPHPSEVESQSPSLLTPTRAKRSILDILAEKILCRSESEDSGIFAMPKVRCLLENKDRLKFTPQELLLVKLFNHSNELQKKIEKIRHPLLHAQIIELYKLCKKKKIGSPFLEPYMDFAVDLALSSSQAKDHLEATQFTIGQLIYLVNKDPALAAKCFTSNNNQTLTNVHNAFDGELKAMTQQLQDHIKAHQEVNIQAGIKVAQTKLPLILAQALLIDTGSINMGIIDAVSNELLPGKGLSNDHEKHMIHVLKTFRQSSKLREELANIQAPASTSMPSNDVIRAALGLPLQTIIDDTHAQQVAFYTLLSHLRQEGMRSCFATSLAIQALATHLSLTLKDFKQLLNESKLTRTINNVRCDIPFLRRIGDENIHRTLIINQDGQLIVEGKATGYLWKAPGIIAACQAIGIPNVKEAILKVITSLDGLDKEPQQITVKGLIKKLCVYSKTINHTEDLLLSDLNSKAQFALSSQTAASPLLKVWENTIANMAEMHEESTVKSNIMQATLYALQLHLYHQKIPPSPVLKAYFQELRKDLLCSIELRYDPCIGDSSTSNTTYTEGAFILYSNEQRIDSAVLFNRFVQNLIEKGATTLESTHSHVEIKILKELLQKHVDSDLFLPIVLATYHPTNEGIKDINECDQRPITPWSTQCGNNSQAVIEVYLEAAIDISRITCKTPQDVLHSLIEIGKKMSYDKKLSYTANTGKCSPIRIPGQHMFSLMLGHPSLSKAWMAKEDSAAWVKKFVLKPGQQVSSTRIDPLTKKQFNAALVHRVLPNFVKEDVNGKIVGAFEKKAEGLSTTLSIKEYRNAIVELCQLFMGTSSQEQLMKQIDAALWDSLEPKLKKQLTQATVHFADSNWCEETQGLNIHFGCTVNPGTGELEICEIDSAGGNFSPLKIKDWTGEQGLELFVIPEELFPDDSVLP